MRKGCVPEEEEKPQIETNPSNSDSSDTNDDKSSEPDSDSDSSTSGSDSEPSLDAMDQPKLDEEVVRDKAAQEEEKKTQSVLASHQQLQFVRGEVFCPRGAASADEKPGEQPAAPAPSGTSRGSSYCNRGKAGVETASQLPTLWTLHCTRLSQI